MTLLAKRISAEVGTYSAALVVMGKVIVRAVFADTAGDSGTGVQALHV